MENFLFPVIKVKVIKVKVIKVIKGFGGNGIYIYNIILKLFNIIL